VVGWLLAMRAPLVDAAMVDSWTCRGGGRRSDPGKEVGDLIRAMDRRQVEDVGLLLLGPGHGLEEADVCLHAGVKEDW
jgi:hypothetical protein